MQPTITPCGLGNHLAEADGRPYCHGLAHANGLHFRWAQGDAVLGNYGRMLGGHGGQLEYPLLDEPTGYLSALPIDRRQPNWSPQEIRVAQMAALSLRRGPGDSNPRA